MKVDPEKYEEIKIEVAEFSNPDMYFADGLEDALIGTVQIFNKVVALYDYERCIKVLIDRDGSTYEGATEHLVNTLGAYVGENTPGYFMRHECLHPQDKVAEVLALASRMSDSDRMELFGELKCEFCIYCGDHTPGDKVCHCWNDE
jgi:hypothetical protein